MLIKGPGKYAVVQRVPTYPRLPGSGFRGFTRETKSKKPYFQQEKTSPGETSNVASVSIGWLRYLAGWRFMGVNKIHGHRIGVARSSEKKTLLQPWLVVRRKGQGPFGELVDVAP